MNLLLLDPSDFLTESQVRVSGPRALHLINVLRIGMGSSLRVGRLNGPIGRAVVTEIKADTIQLECFWEQTPAPPSVDLLLAMPRPKAMKRLWPQLGALGVRQIAITNAERVAPFYFASHVLAPSFYVPRLIEGLQQAQDTHLPEVRIEKRLKVFLEDHLEAWAPGSVRLFADPPAESSLTDVLPRGSERVVVAIGPEEGWSPYERDLLAHHAFRAFTLGRRTLRSDTACVAVLTLVRAQMNPTRSFD